MALDADDYVLRGSIPEWLPAAIKRWLRDLTYKEWHGIVLGLSGLLAGPAIGHGSPLVQAGGVIATLVILGVAFFDLPFESGSAAWILSTDTWYFVVPYTLLSILSYAVVGVL